MHTASADADEDEYFEINTRMADEDEDEGNDQAEDEYAGKSQMCPYATFT